jgi:hypothetical protein
VPTTTWPTEPTTITIRTTTTTDIRTTVATVPTTTWPTVPILTTGPTAPTIRIDRDPDPKPSRHEQQHFLSVTTRSHTSPTLFHRCRSRPGPTLLPTVLFHRCLFSFTGVCHALIYRSKRPLQQACEGAEQAMRHPSYQRAKKRQALMFESE